MSIQRRRGKDGEEGNYLYRFTYKKKDYCEGGFRTKAQAEVAERLAKDKAIAQAQNPDDYAGEMTFGQAGQWWLKEWAPNKRSRKNKCANCVTRRQTSGLQYQQLNRSRDTWDPHVACRWTSKSRTVRVTREYSVLRRLRRLGFSGHDQRYTNQI